MEKQKSTAPKKRGKKISKYLLLFDEYFYYYKSAVSQYASLDKLSLYISQFQSIMKNI